MPLINRFVSLKTNDLGNGRNYSKYMGIFIIYDLFYVFKSTPYPLLCG